jgi:hypothetical protein
MTAATSSNSRERQGRTRHTLRMSRNLARFDGGADKEYATFCIADESNLMDEIKQELIAPLRAL